MLFLSTGLLFVERDLINVIFKLSWETDYCPAKAEYSHLESIFKILFF